MDLSQMTEVGYGIAVVMYLAAWVQHIRWFASEDINKAKSGQRLLWLGLLLHVMALVFRGIVSEHAPWSNQYESLTFVSFGVILLYLVFQKKHSFPLAGIIVIPLAVMAVASATMLPASLKLTGPTMPALNSYWIWIHVSCLLISYGAFATTFALSLLYLIRDGGWTKKTNLITLPAALGVIVWFFFYVHSTTRDSSFWAGYSDFCASLGLTVGVAGNKGALALAALIGVLLGLLTAVLINKTLKASWMSRLPEAKTLDELNYRSVALGFPLLTLGIILGAFWGHVAWGRYWAWDPKETWSFITFLVYGFYLHFRIVKGWQGRNLAWIGLLGFVCVVFTYWGVNFLLSGLHAYAAP